ncbi:MAG: sigma-70 family RNA polymerase sigma factor [Phycisphaerales bacterium]
MTDASPPTRLLEAASRGESQAAADLLPLVYDELRGLAAAYFRNERNDHTLEPTALVHEAYVRMIDVSDVTWRSRGQFFVIAAKAMRNVLVDHARSRGRIKRGGDRHRVTISAIDAAAAGGVPPEDPVDLEALDRALVRLAELDERKAQLVELRFFAGLDERVAADVLGMARSTASEHWRMARAWLHSELRDDESAPPTSEDAPEGGRP